MIQVVNIILIIIAVIVMIKQSLSLTAKSELRRPKTYIFGIVLILGVVVSYFLSAMYYNPNYFSTSWLLAYALPIVVAISTLLFLKQNK